MRARTRPWTASCFAAAGETGRERLVAGCERSSSAELVRSSGSVSSPGGRAEEEEEESEWMELAEGLRARMPGELRERMPDELRERRPDVMWERMPEVVAERGRRVGVNTAAGTGGWGELRWGDMELCRPGPGKVLECLGRVGRPRCWDDRRELSADIVARDGMWF